MELYDAVASGECTDQFTRRVMLDILEPFNETSNYIVVTTGIMILLTCVSSVALLMTIHNQY